MCVYRTKDGKCLKYSENGVVSFCVDGPCPHETPSNADRIRAMSDEKLADTMCRNPIFTVCDSVCKGDCKAVDTLNDTKDAICKRTILDWL